MTISAKVLADSVHTLGARPQRITTFELRYQRFVHSEVLTHRQFSRNAASSRAIPVLTMIGNIEREPALPVYYGKNCRGMQAHEEMTEAEREEARRDWLEECSLACARARRRAEKGWHKQLANRPLEAWQEITVILTATDWASWYALRRHPAAQPEVQALSEAMWHAHKASTPVDRTHLKGINRWHLPLVSDTERYSLMSAALKVCVGRCARVSLLTHDGRRDFGADVGLHDQLVGDKHWSPFEHAALPFRQPWWKRWVGHNDRVGNFNGWLQYRKQFASEHPYTPGQVEP